MPVTKMQRIDKYKEIMNRLANSGDTEMAHSEADEALCVLLRELGYGAVVEVYESVEKWYA